MATPNTKWRGTALLLVCLAPATVHAQTFVQSKVNAVTGTAVGVLLDALPIEGNLLVACVFTRAATLTNPMGWTTAVEEFNATESDWVRIAYTGGEVIGLEGPWGYGGDGVTMSPMTTIHGQEFINTTIHIDNTMYRNCTITGSTIVYSGGAPGGFTGCEISRNKFVLGGAALETVKFMATLHAADPNLRQIVEGWIAQIRGESGESTLH